MAGEEPGQCQRQCRMVCHLAGCLLQGKVYSEIRRETGASSATVSRVNRMLNYGTGSVAESVREDLAAQGVTADTKE